MARLVLSVLVLTPWIAAAVGCADDSQRLSAEGENCARTADCEYPLICVDLVCRRRTADAGASDLNVDRYAYDGPASAEGTGPTDSKPADLSVDAPSSQMLPINIVYYGVHNTTVDNQIIVAEPEILISNTPAGPWTGNCDSAKFQAAGVKVFSYIDGGYENTVARAIPNDVASNLAFIEAIANEGTHGVFLDEVSSSPSQAGYSYLAALWNKAQTHGVKLICNTGVNSWDTKLMSYCDYIQCSEQYAGGDVTTTMLAYPGRVMMLTEKAPSLTAAVSYTQTAWSKGVKLHYATTSYMVLPSWFDSYVAALKATSP